MPDKKPKIFFVSPPKTGSKTFSEALRILGWNSTHDNGAVVAAAKKRDAAWFNKVKFNAFFNCHTQYEWLSRQFSEALFIYSQRSIDETVMSCFKHSIARARSGVANHNVPWSNPALMHKTLLEHRCALLNYFAGSKGLMKRIHIQRPEDGWKPLCEFLGCDIPEETFPHMNKADTLEDLFLSRKRSKMRDAV